MAQKARGPAIKPRIVRVVSGLERIQSKLYEAAETRDHNDRLRPYSIPTITQIGGRSIEGVGGLWAAINEIADTSNAPGRKLDYYIDIVEGARKGSTTSSGVVAMINDIPLEDGGLFLADERCRLRNHLGLEPEDPSAQPEQRRAQLLGYVGPYARRLRPEVDELNRQVEGGLYPAYLGGLVVEEAIYGAVGSSA